MLTFKNGIITHFLAC